MITGGRQGGKTEGWKIVHWKQRDSKTFPETDVYWKEKPSGYCSANPKKGRYFVHMNRKHEKAFEY